MKPDTYIAIGINGSITTLRRCPKWKFQLLCLSVRLLVSSMIKNYPTVPVSNYKRADMEWNNAIDVDRLDYLVSKLMSEVKVQLSQFPLRLKIHVRTVCQIFSEGDVSVDLVQIIKKILSEEFEGISL